MYTVDSPLSSAIVEQFPLWGSGPSEWGGWGGAGGGTPEGRNHSARTGRFGQQSLSPLSITLDWWWKLFTQCCYGEGRVVPTRRKSPTISLFVLFHTYTSTATHAHAHTEPDRRRRHHYNNNTRLHSRFRNLARTHTTRVSLVKRQRLHSRSIGYSYTFVSVVFFVSHLFLLSRDS